jgi:hypothetical protein
MDRLTLLATARAAGLAVYAAGERLVVRGPRSAGGLAQELIARKAEVLALLGVPPQARKGFSRFLVSSFVPVTLPDTRAAASEPAVARRVAAMRERHPRPWPAIPFLTARDVKVAPSQCHSCGEPAASVDEGMVARCWPCVQAARLVIAGA